MIETPTVRRLRAVPRSERRDALEALVVAQFKATLLMTDDEDLPLDGSYFDLGFTSLRITEIKQRLEELLGCGVSTNVLFNSPTVDELMTYLTGEALPELFDDTPAEVAAPYVVDSPTQMLPQLSADRPFEVVVARIDQPAPAVPVAGFDTPAQAAPALPVARFDTPIDQPAETMSLAAAMEAQAPAMEAQAPQPVAMEIFDGRPGDVVREMFGPRPPEVVAAETDGTPGTLYRRSDLTNGGTPVPNHPAPADHAFRAARDTLDQPGASNGRQVKARHEPIAIVGVGLRFPGGNDTPDGFAEFLREGRSGIRPVPEDRWNVEAFRPSDPEEKGKVHTTGAGFLDQIDQFDAGFFNISPKETDFVDPQQRLLLETAWEALENANINPSTLRHSNGGVYIGASSIDYALEMEGLSYEDLDGHLASGITTFPLSGRVSYFLGLRGPSISVDTACASSLTAMHMAVNGLRGGECNIALAGAVNCLHHPRIFVMFSHANMLAPDGQCKTFDESADGYVRAEGAGVVVLKRLSDAQRDGDRILALVRGTAIGQDGESAGLTVPNGTAQSTVIRAALANAELEPTDIQYVEAHGTGTPLGDPIEMGAIRDVFAKSHTKDVPLVVGSVKTNLGHMEPVAGIGGVVKTVLQLREGTIYPHLNFHTPSGRIPWDTYPVEVPTGPRPWPAATTRRAVVNSFGFAGAIAAVALEQAPPAPAEPVGEPDPGPHVFTLSAKTRKSLRLQIERYQGFLGEQPDTDLGDLAYTSNVGRTHFPHRLAAVVRDRDELTAALDKQLARLEKATQGGGGGDIRKTALLFTGQGSQYAGMGAALYKRYPLFRLHVDACDRLFYPHLGRSVRDMILGTAPDPDEIHQTRYTQPALFTLEYALAQLWLSWGVKPSVLIGHSIGEVVAAAVAGLFDLEDAVTLVAARARLMQSVTAPGGMAAVPAPVAEVEPLLAGYADLAIAGINSPQQCVVSGGRESLAAVTEVLTARGLDVRQLPVSHAFHSPLMNEVFDAFRSAIAGVRFREPSITLISNVTGEVAKPAEIGNPEYWVRHIGAPVNFEAGMRAVDRRGRHAFVEVGPSSALTSLAKQCVPAADHLWINSMHPKDREGLTLVEAVAQMYTAGLPLSWTGFHDGHPHRKVVLPTYAFDRKRYWLPFKGERHGLGTRVADGNAVHPLLGTEITAPEQAAAGVREFAGRFSAAQPAYLADHVAMGQVVFPGTGYVEIMLALQDAVYGDTRRPITDLQLREALFLTEDQTTQVRTRLRRQPDGSAAVEIVSLVDTKDGVIERGHAVATIAATPERVDALTEHGQTLRALAGEAGAADETFEPDDIYAAYSAAGLDYGPQFRRARWATKHGTDLAVGEIAGQDTGAVEHVPPALLDASMHVLAALAPEDGNNYLPVRWSRFRLFKKPKAANLTALLRTVPPDVPGVDLCADVVVLEDDQPVFELRGLGMKRVADSVGAARKHFFHELRWTKRSLTQGGQGDKHVLVVNRTAAELADLAEPAAGAGIRLSFAATTEQAAAILREQQVTDVCWFWRAGSHAVNASALRAECEYNYRDLLGVLNMLSDEGFGRNQKLWLVTERGQWLPGDRPGTGEHLAAATLWGFGHVVLNEYPAYRTTMVDLPGDGHTPLLDEWQGRDAGEFQVAHRGGHRHVRRLVPSDVAARQDGNFELAIKEYGQFAGIKQVPAEDIAPVGDQIQVEVQAAGLNFKDVLNALGMLKEFGEQPLGFECAGTVVAAGPTAEFAVGDEVIINYLGLFKRRVTVPSAVAVRKPANVTFTEAAGLVSVYVTAYYALHETAKMAAGDRVLIHAAAGGVGQAAVHLAKLAGAEVFATASPHKWPLLRSQGVRHLMNSRTLDFADQIVERTGGHGVNIVLNSLNKDFIPAGMRSLGQGGRFIELGKVGAWTPEQVAAERPDVTYHNFDLSELPEETLIRVNKEIMQKVVALVGEGKLPPIPATTYTLDEVEEAFGVLSRGANIGKLVLSFTDEHAPPAREVTVDADHTYLITGGLGAIGLVTAEKLVDLGARHIALVGRRTTAAADVAHLEARLRERAQVTVYQGDMASADDVGRIFDALKQSPYPLGGIVHSAGALSDAAVSAQTWETIDTVFQAKVYGTWLLTQAAESFPDLQFFLGYSSAASVVGGATQSNYAAGNAFIDNLMRWRSARGLPSLSINWGPWAEVGMSARLSDQLLKKWEDEGIRLFTPAKGARALASLLGKPVAQVVVGECDWDRFVAAKPVNNALYKHLIRAGDDDAAGIDLDAVLAQPKRERAAAIDEYVRAKVAGVLHMDDVDAVDSHTEFVRLGLDSLVAVELKNALEAAFRIPLPASIAFDHPSAGQLAEFLDRQLVPDQAA